jgi:hypothetical protein
MRVYFDLENFISYVKSYWKPRFDECNRMLKKQVDMSFNFTREDLREYLNDEDFKAWLKTMVQGRGTSEVYNVPEFPHRPLRSNTYKSFDKEQLSSVYLLKDERIQMLVDGGNLLWGKVGDEVSVLNRLIMDKSDYGFVKTVQARKLKNWDELDEYLMPNTDIILVDRYIASDENRFGRNICSLLTTICGKRQAPTGQLNIVIFTQFADPGKGTPLDSPQWSILYEKIKSEVNCQSGIKPNITFILQRRLTEHDRTIIMNYQFIVSGDTLNYMGEMKNDTHGRYLHIHSVANKDEMLIAKATLSDLQKIIDDMKKLNNPDLIKFDKKSNFLTFPK